MGCFESQNTQPTAVYSGQQTHGIAEDLNQAVFMATDEQAGGGLSKQVQLSISATGLPNMDTFSLSDPLCVVFIERKGKWVQFGRTEVIMDNLNPQWVKSFELAYKFQERQRLLFQVYDVDDFSDKAPLSSHDYIGRVEVLLHEIVGSPHQKLTRIIHNEKRQNKKNGQLTLSLNNNDTESKELVKLILTGQSFTSSNKLFLTFYRQNPGAHRVPVFRSELQSLKGGGDRLEWNKIQILTTSLAQKGEKDVPFEIEVFQYRKNGSHKILGRTECTLNQLLEYSEGKRDIVMRGAKAEMAGILRIKSMQIEERFSFLQYIYGGCHMHLMIGIDFTLSNGDPKSPSSLHFFDPNRNEYLQAIHSVGDILQCYDTDRNIAVYGFGAQIPPVAGRSSHCFALNGNIFNPKLQGVPNIVDCYRNALNQVKLYGPTHFSEIVAMAVDQASHQQISQYNQHYYTLLILTDGIINDMDSTIDQIVRGSSLPLSIIIVGVGGQDFSAMEVLDADDKPLYSSKLQKQMERDIVQFVPFREFKDDPYRLAQETLEEVPRQFISYMSLKSIQPNIEGLQHYQPVPVQHGLDFFGVRKEQFIAQLMQLGYAENDIRNLIEYGIPEEKINFVIDVIKNPYQNPLLYQNRVLNFNEEKNLRRTGTLKNSPSMVSSAAESYVPPPPAVPGARY